VATKGIESSVEGSFSINKYGFIKLTLLYTYLNSALEKTDYLYPDDVLGKQMIFTPMHKGNFVFRWIKGQSFVEYQQLFVGRLFTTTDNSEFLPAFSLGNINIGHNFSIKKKLISTTFKLYNIWNSVYYTMPNYAMPRINYEISIRLKLKTK